MWVCVEKCQTVWKSAETILPFSCCPLVLLWFLCVIRGCQVSQAKGLTSGEFRLLLGGLGLSKKSLKNSWLSVALNRDWCDYSCVTRVPFEAKLLPAVLLFLRIYFPKIAVTVTVLNFGWIHLLAITVTVLASAVTPSFPLIPDYRLESHLKFLSPKLPLPLPSWNVFELER